jgi:hypothetical protein
MSWSGSGVVPAGFDKKATADLIEGIAVVGNEDHAKERDAAAKAAKQAAIAILESGALGDNSSSFAVSLSGHANKNHVPEGNWSQDSISINLYRKPE